MTEAQIKYMVDRFLGWKLPSNFAPDGGVSFEKLGNAGTQYEYKHEPVGTNLLDAEQATEMVRHMIEGLPPGVPVIDDLRKNWSSFCDADPFDGAADFTERMEAAGLIELVPVTKHALEESFAVERGIEPGGMMWVLTAVGRAALAPDYRS